MYRVVNSNLLGLRIVSEMVLSLTVKTRHRHSDIMKREREK